MYETSCQSRFDARYWMLGAGALGPPHHTHRHLTFLVVQWLRIHLAIQGTSPEQLRVGRRRRRGELGWGAARPDPARLKGVNPPVKFGERTRDCSPGQAGKEGPHLSLTGASCGFSQTAAPLCVFSRGTREGLRAWGLGRLSWQLKSQRERGRGREGEGERERETGRGRQGEGDTANKEVQTQAGSEL